MSLKERPAHQASQQYDEVTKHAVSEERDDSLILCFHPSLSTLYDSNIVNLTKEEKTHCHTRLLFTDFDNI